MAVKFRCRELSCVTGSRPRLAGLGLTRASWTDLFPCGTLLTYLGQDPREKRKQLILRTEARGVGGGYVLDPAGESPQATPRAELHHESPLHRQRRKLLDGRSIIGRPARSCVRCSYHAQSIRAAKPGRREPSVEFSWILRYLGATRGCAAMKKCGGARTRPHLSSLSAGSRERATLARE